MINPSPSDSVNCASIPTLLQDVDCKLVDLAKILYNNTIFALNQPVKSTVYLDLMHYKRILTYRSCNPDYALPYTTEMIASKVKLLKFK